MVDPRKKEPEPTTLELHSLTSLVEFVLARRDDAYGKKCGGTFLHVESEARVSLVTSLFGDFHQRVVLARVDATVPDHTFGSFVGQEQFVIGLLTHFEPSTERDAVLKFAGNLTSEQTQTVVDDGVSQMATAKKALSMLEKVKVPSPVTLRPHRSFPEIAQPESPFVLRVRAGDEGKQPGLALFECDGGRWVLEAVARLKAHLKTEVAGAIEVYG